MTEKILAILWIVVFVGGGGLVAFNFRGAADRIFDLMERFVIGGVGDATTNTVRLIGGAFVGISLIGSFVILTGSSQKQ
ncbi:hypothetical protein [Kitasatospora mediocidica]|uniref:hypothetical protein n=1 Tax=Kitasatospora mediocidica TaxID=58352 RepID=UPI00055AF30C|nr:hypothetical protein [Kitasatospora mediocidica]